jgi:hypothetical protein
MAFHIPENATRPDYVVTLYDYYGTPRQKPVDLTAAVNAELVVRKRGEADSLFRRPIDILEPLDEGQVVYTWQAGDTAQRGRYDALVIVTWADGGVEKFPQKGFLEINIGDDLEAP